MMSPWADSRGVQCRHVAKAPRPPVPPPVPRRYSDPTTQNSSNTSQKKHRRFSEIQNPKPEVDLRQELLQLDLSTRDVNKWLGNKFDEKEEEYEIDFRFNHDIPLQRTISLDRGIEIFNYLNTLSETSGSSNSVGVSFWALGSDEDGSSLRVEQYRSFEDIPASPVKGKSRHVSVDVTNTMLGNSVAFSVLKESYKGIDSESGRVTPQIRKLQTTFSFKNFDEYKESAKNSTESLARAKTEVDLNAVELKPPAHVYRSISYESEDRQKSENRNLRQRRHGVTSNLWQENPIQHFGSANLIEKNLIYFKSNDDVFKQDYNSCRGSTETRDKDLKVTFFEGTTVTDKSDAIRNLSKIKSKFSGTKSEFREFVLPTIIVTEDICNETDVENVDNNNILSQENNILSETSNLVEIGRHCNCSICSGTEGEKKQSFLGKNLSKIFKRIVLYKEYGRKLAYLEENNLNENEMYTCFIHLLKLLLGLWLRHLDHKHHNLCA